MKTKKIVIGAMAAAMLSLSVCSLAPAVAADETVQISVSKATAEAGGQFTVDVSLADIPAAGIQACNFSLKYDSSVLKIDSITAGALTETGAADKDASAASLPNFNYFAENEGLISLMWSTSLDDASYWLKGEGTFCTISGTVADNAAPGEYAISIVPTERETYTNSGVTNNIIDCGYMKDGAKVIYQVSTADGSVTIPGKAATTTTATPSVTTTVKAGDGKYLKGDANVDGNVTVSDAVAIIQSVGNKDKYGLTDQGKINGDVDGVPGITANDALLIQRYNAHLISEL